MGKQKNQHQNPKLTIVAPQNSPKVLERFENLNLIVVEDENPNPIVVENVHVSKLKKKKNF
jgi:hypothetical protein